MRRSIPEKVWQTSFDLAAHYLYLTSWGLKILNNEQTPKLHFFQYRQREKKAVFDDEQRGVLMCFAILLGNCRGVF